MKASRKISDDELQQSLAQDFGWKFEGPFYTDAAVPRSEYVGEFDYEVRRIHNHLLDTMIIEDQFDKDHDGRRDFLLERKICNFTFRASKLRWNNLYAVVASMRDMRESLREKFPEVFKRLGAIHVSQMYDVVASSCGYGKMTFQQKVAIARAVDETAYLFLEILAR